MEGSDPEKYIVSVEYDYISDSIYKIKQLPDKGLVLESESFTPFAWVSDFTSIKFYNSDVELQKAAKTKYKIVIEKLRTDDNFRLKNGLKYLVKSLDGYRSLISFFRDGGIDPWGEQFKNDILILSPVEQFLIQKEKRLFKGFDEYNDINRLVFDLETTSLDPKTGRIFMIGIKDNRGYRKVLECSDDQTEKEAIVEFFNILNELKPSIIAGYNSANFDWNFLFERCKILKINIKDVAKTLHSKYKIKTKDAILKLGNEVEPYTQVDMWGFSIIDIIHSVRRAQAINSDIKSAGLKYITKYLQLEAKDRVYIEHKSISNLYYDTNDYWLNTLNGNYKKVGVDSKIDSICEKKNEIYTKVKGSQLVEMYLDDDLEETLKVDEEFNQGSFLLAGLVPTTYLRICTMGTASLWKMLMLAWSYKNGLAIPKKDTQRDFVGGLSRLLKVGYSKNVLKLDFSSLYPSIQLVHDIFPDCDITGVMKSLLKYFRDTRISYKNLAEQLYETDNKKSLSYGRKQLPIKIFINSMFGALSAPNVFPWADMNKGEQITCTGRQYLRQMINFFIEKGYTPLVMDTDGVNFSKPDGYESRVYIGKGLNWKVKLGKEYYGDNADVAEFNDKFMRGEMALDTDGTWPACINLSRKNYAVIDAKGKVKLTGATIKSKKLPIYIEEFLDKGIKLLLNGSGYEFIEWYYEYIELIYNQQIPLRKIAQRAKVKLTIDEYIQRLKTKTKAGHGMSRMAHMELVIKENLKVNLGDEILYINNGKKVSTGDVQKIKKPKKGWSEEQIEQYYSVYGKNPNEASDHEIFLNCYILNHQDVENNPNMIGEYNFKRSIAIFNKRIEPLLVCFHPDIRDSILVDSPDKREFFTKEQCTLVNGYPFEAHDQDDLNDDVMLMENRENIFWENIGVNPNYIYTFAEENVVN